MTARHVDDLFDEVFDDPDSVDAAHHGGIPDPLLAELERSRTGEMRDIVATIAAEQDVVIRAPLDTCLVVQGGPGHRQDGRRAPPGRLPAVRAPGAARPRGRARRRPEPAVPAVHRPGAAVAGRGGDPADDRRAAGGRAGGARRTRPRSRASRATPRMAAAARRRRPRPPAAARPRTCRWPRRGAGCGSRADDLADAVEEIVARDVPFAVGRNAFRTRVRRLAWLGHPDSKWEDAAPVGRLRRRDAHQHRAQHRGGEDLAVAVGAGAREARPHEPAGARSQAADGLLDADEQRALLRTVRAPSASTTSRGRSRSWCWWTRPRRCSTVSGAPTATRWWTRRRTSPPWSCAPSPAAARRAR